MSKSIIVAAKALTIQILIVKIRDFDLPVPEAYRRRFLTAFSLFSFAPFFLTIYPWAISYWYNYTERCFNITANINAVVPYVQ